ncbi:MAG: hypothetical protein ABI583_03695, partial [Betaproteobacteria bacterium]
ESEIAIALRLVRGADDSFEQGSQSSSSVPLLGDALIEQGLVKRAVFDSAMQTYRPDQHGRVGDYLVESGVIMRDVIERVVERQRMLQAAAVQASARVGALA